MRKWVGPPGRRQEGNRKTTRPRAQQFSVILAFRTALDIDIGRIDLHNIFIIPRNPSLRPSYIVSEEKVVVDRQVAFYVWYDQSFSTTPNAS